MSFNLRHIFARLQFDSRARLATYRKIGIMLRNGTRLELILRELHRRASRDGTREGEGTAIVYRAWLEAVLEGGTLAEAVEGWVPPTEVMLIEAGERAGNLPEQFDTLIKVANAARQIRGMVIAGLGYPLALLGATVGYLFLFGYKVVPQFAMISNPERWGGLAQSLYHMSLFVRGWGVALVLALLLLGTGVVVVLPRLRGRLRIVLDRAVPFSIYRLITGTGFLLALAALLGGGARVQDALARMRRHATPYLDERLEAFLVGINSGLNAGDAMRDAGYDFPSRELVDDMGVYAEQSGDFSAVIRIVAQQWLTEGIEALGVQLRLLNGVSIAAMAVVLMWIVGGVFAIQGELTALNRP